MYLFDEPSIGPHPLVVRTLLQGPNRLPDTAATAVVTGHDLDVIDKGPGDGPAGGRIVASAPRVR